MKKIKILELLESVALCTLELVDSRDNKDDFAQALSQLEDEIRLANRCETSLPHQERR